MKKKKSKLKSFFASLFSIVLGGFWIYIVLGLFKNKSIDINPLVKYALFFVGLSFILIGFFQIRLIWKNLFEKDDSLDDAYLLDEESKIELENILPENLDYNELDTISSRRKKTKEELSKHCKRCQTPLRPSDKYCPECGKKIKHINK